jgi:hypothetical protein
MGLTRIFYETDLASFVIIFFVYALSAQSLLLKDVPWDDGKALELHWQFPACPILSSYQ